MLDPFTDLESITLNATFFLAIFTAGLLGSAHCAGMCGPLSHLVSKSWQQNLFYNFGRLLGYSSLGVLFGGMGHIFIDSDFAWLRWTGAGLAMAFILFSLYGMLTGRHISYFLPGWLRERFFRFAKTKGQMTQGFYLGLLTCILPCGWLMTFAGVSAAAATPVAGAAIMAVFWLSTLPVMTLVPLNAHKLIKPLQKKSPVLVAFLIAASSILVIALRFKTTHSCH